LADELFNRPLLLTGDAADGPTVPRLRFHAYGLIQDLCPNVMRMSDERNAHPAPNRLILPADQSRMAAGAVSKDKRKREGAQKGQ
jgi:hypothetical protein